MRNGCVQNETSMQLVNTMALVVTASMLLLIGSTDAREITTTEQRKGKREETRHFVLLYLHTYRDDDIERDNRPLLAGHTEMVGSSILFLGATLELWFFTVLRACRSHFETKKKQQQATSDFLP